jgi:hypothetical protein
MLTLAASPVLADDFGNELKRFLYDDATATLHFRSYYLDRTNPQPPNQAAWAGGGWVGYQTGWLYDILRAGAVEYTSQPLWAPTSTDGTLLLLPGQYGFAVLGQAYVSLKAHDQVFTGYRQLVDELEVNPNDDRMVPNTFEAYALRGSFGKVSYFAGYVAAMKPRDSNMFVNMAERAGAPAKYTAGMWLGRITYDLNDNLQFRSSAYYVPDILTSNYNEALWSHALFDWVRIRLASNFMVQGSNGQNLLTGKPFGTWSAGVRGDLTWDWATVSAVYTQTGSAADYRTPYGQWIGYTKQITKDFDRANERAFQIGGFFDFASAHAPGLSLKTNATFGSNTIDPATGAPLPNNTEYDFDLEYRLTAESWPDWMKSLELRGRAALIDTSLNGVTTKTTEFRVIVNYEIKFGGAGR